MRRELKYYSIWIFLSRFNETASIQMRIPSTNPSPNHQPKTPLLTSSTPASPVITVGKRLWTKVRSIENEPSLFFSLENFDFIRLRIYIVWKRYSFGMQLILFMPV